MERYPGQHIEKKEHRLKHISILGITRKYLLTNK